MSVPSRSIRTWSSTLSLPKSAFPARALAADQPRYLKQCTDDLYTRQRHDRLHKPLFILHDGPPYANGDLHVGHALNKILKDIVCRFQLSQGKRIDYVPGWDCHGLPIELKALQQQQKLSSLGNSKKLGAVAIRKAARELATKAVEVQKKQFRGWGIMADWDNAWKTMDTNFEMKQLEVFRELVRKGLINRRFKPVYWSPSSGTALAEAELEYKEDHVSTAAFICYALTSIPPRLAAKLDKDTSNISIVIWTTTPWTLTANKAIAVHSGLDYVLVKSSTHGTLLLSNSRLSDVEKLCETTLPIISGPFRGTEIIGATYRNPAVAPETSHQPILHADFVSADSGSGLVHLAPGHGMDDYELCRKNEIPASAPVDNEGCFTDLALPVEPELLTGKEVLHEGNEAVLRYMFSCGRVLKTHKYTHKYPYDWRSKQPIIVRATEQWFCDVGKIRAAAMQSLETVTFIPGGGRERLESFVKNRSEWCISRQRAWGVPIPVLYHKDTGEAVLTDASISYIMSTIQDRGIDSWWSDDELDPIWTPPNLRESSGETSFVRGKDTMDVWFDSGTSWTQTAKSDEQGRKHVADVYVEGTDQHRGWFQSSLLTHIANQDSHILAETSPKAPYKTLITHGFTLDQDGRKMSKSIGNVISPEEIMNGTLLLPMKRKKGRGIAANLDHPVYDAMGSDALHLWVASSDYTKDIVIGQPVLKAINGSLSKYRVTLKLLLGLLKDFNPLLTIPFGELNCIHQLALVQLKNVNDNVHNYYHNFEFHKVVNSINKYINTDLSSLYIEMIKDSLYADAVKSQSRVQAQFTLFRIYKYLQAMLNPITPLLIEETIDYEPEQIKQRATFQYLWVDSSGDECLSDGSWHNQQLQSDIPHLLAANAAVKIAQESARVEKKMGSSLQSFIILRFESRNSALQTFERYRDDLATLLVVSKVDLCVDHMPKEVSMAEWSYKAELNVDAEKVQVVVYQPQKSKCVRCWKYTAPVDTQGQEALCERCERVMEVVEKDEQEFCKDVSNTNAAAAA
ncbi:isoleucine-tRNA ligase [Toensbergia leucococca]|nr:isoleucine-tRNA ligase [Toensbergia leucococca]